MEDARPTTLWIQSQGGSSVENEDSSIADTHFRSETWNHSNATKLSPFPYWSRIATWSLKSIYIYTNVNMIRNMKTTLILHAVAIFGMYAIIFPTKSWIWISFYSSWGKGFNLLILTTEASHFTINVKERLVECIPLRQIQCDPLFTWIPTIFPCSFEVMTEVNQYLTIILLDNYIEGVFSIALP